MQVLDNSTNPFVEEPETLDKDNPFFEQDTTTKTKVKVEISNENNVPNLTPFYGLISHCFEPYLHIYIESQDQNLVELIDRAAQEQKTKGCCYGCVCRIQFRNLKKPGSGLPRP